MSRQARMSNSKNRLALKKYLRNEKGLFIGNFFAKQILIFQINSFIAIYYTRTGIAGGRIKLVNIFLKKLLENFPKLFIFLIFTITKRWVKNLRISTIKQLMFIVWTSTFFLAYCISYLYFFCLLLFLMRKIGGVFQIYINQWKKGFKTPYKRAKKNHSSYKKTSLTIIAEMFLFFRWRWKIKIKPFMGTVIYFKIPSNKTVITIYK